MRQSLSRALRLAVLPLTLASVALAVTPALAADSFGNATRTLTVPNSPEAFAAIRTSGARVVANYDVFTLVEADARRIKQLLKVGGELRDDMRSVRVGRHTFDPAKADAYLPAKTGRAARLSERGGYGLMVVQYVGPLKRTWIEEVRATGVEIVTYMAQNAQLVAGDRGALSALNALASSGNFIRAVVPYDVEAKKQPGLQRGGMTQVTISTVAGRAGDSSRTAIASLGQTRGNPVKVGGVINQRVVLDAAQIDYLAEFGGVVAIEPWIEPRLHDERAAMIVAGQLNASFQPILGTGYRQFLTSRGFSTNSQVIIDITDEGVDKGVVPPPAGSHPAFFRFGDPANPSRLVYAQEATLVDPDARDCGGHGTNVASIATGYMNATGGTHEDPQGFNFAMGVQPFGRLGATKIFNCFGNFDVQTSITALHSAAFGFGARISNNSWGANVGGAYNASSQEFDALVRDVQPGVAGIQQFVEVVSAGNSGPGGNTIGAPGTAKNVITVGASENVRPIGFTDGCGVTDAGADSARDIINFSSRGPTDDGRIKPDIVAPGTHVAGAQPQTAPNYNGTGTCNPQFPAGSTLYTLVSGTSQAAPEATGFASLIFSWFKDLTSKFPSPAMTKALMVNTATDLVGGDAGNSTINENVPTQHQGWGRINLGTLLDGTQRQFVDQAQRIANTGSAHTRFFPIAQAAKPLRVTLVWTDVPGPTSGNSFVNDLDLEVTAGGQIYKGNVFSGGRSVTGGATDPRNNLENVFLPPGTRGNIMVRVIGKNIAADGVPGNADITDQDYALVVSNANAELASAPVLQHVNTVTNPAGDGDNFLEPGEPFTLRLALKNVGNATANSILGTLTAPGGDATITQGASAWANIGVGVTKTNTTVLKGTVKNSIGCGELVNLRVAVASNAGPLVLPLALPTGKPGPAQTFASSDVPKAIPDNNPAGATSTISIPGTGFINNVDVTIGSLTHTFIGDVQIELTSPQGTTVRLFDKRGGSGDNLTNTLFSDSAATPIGSGVAPFTGSFLPEQPLSAFKGEQSNGTWTLTVRDTASADTGTLQSWSITRERFVCN